MQPVYNTEDCQFMFTFMMYSSTPYVGMATKKTAATLKVHKINDTLEKSALD